MKRGDKVIVNASIKDYAGKRVPQGRAEVVRISQDDPKWVVIRLPDADYHTTVPRFALDPITVLDKIVDALNR